MLCTKAAFSQVGFGEGMLFGIEKRALPNNLPVPSYRSSSLASLRIALPAAVSSKPGTAVSNEAMNASTA